MLTADQAIGRLKSHIAPFRRKGDAAKALGVSQSNLSDMLHGKRPLAPSVLTALNLDVVRVTMYQEKTNAE